MSFLYNDYYTEIAHVCRQSLLHCTTWSCTIMSFTVLIFLCMKSGLLSLMKTRHQSTASFSSLSLSCLRVYSFAFESIKFLLEECCHKHFSKHGFFASFSSLPPLSTYLFIHPREHFFLQNFAANTSLNMGSLRSMHDNDFQFSINILDVLPCYTSLDGVTIHLVTLLVLNKIHVSKIFNNYYTFETMT